MPRTTKQQPTSDAAAPRRAASKRSTSNSAAKQEASAGAGANASASADEIAQRAYELYCARGRTPGRELDDWLRAEQELDA